MDHTSWGGGVAARVCLSFSPAVGPRTWRSSALSPSLFFTLPAPTHLSLVFLPLTGLEGRSFLGSGAAAHPCGWCGLPLLPPFTPEDAGVRLLGRLFGLWGQTLRQTLRSSPDPPPPPSSSASLRSHLCNGLTPLALQDVQARGVGGNGICTNVRMSVCHLVSLPPHPGSCPVAGSPHIPPPPPACLPPSQTLSLPGAQMCGKRRREFLWGNLLPNPASARIFSLSLNLPRFVILLLSLSIRAAGLGRHPAPRRGHRHCPPSRVTAAWRGRGVQVLPLSVPQFLHP